MKLDELFPKRGDVLEIAEILDMEPDDPVPDDLQSIVMILKFMPEHEPGINWGTIVEEQWHSLFQLPLEECRLSILDNAILCLPDTFPCDFTGNTVKFKAPCKVVTYHLGNQYKNYYGKQNKPTATSKK